jgi:rubredoxin
MVNEKIREYGGKDSIVLCNNPGALRKMNKPKPQHFAEVKLLWYCPYCVFQKRNRVMISSGSKHDKGGVFLTH